MRGTMKTKSLVFVTLLVAALMFASIQGCATSPAQPIGDLEQKIDQAVADSSKALSEAQAAKSMVGTDAQRAEAAAARAERAADRAEAAAALAEEMAQKAEAIFMQKMKK